jgi:hypothetical protein
MDRTFEYYVDTTPTTTTSNSSITPVNKNVELRESNRIAAAKTRDKKKRAELEKRQRHEEKEELNRRLKGVEAKQRELINVMLNEIVVKKVENFFDGENALIMKQEQPTNEVTTNDEYNSQADWQPESSSSSFSILQGNDKFGCLNEDNQLHELDLQDWDFTQALPSSLLITSESDCVLDTTTTTTTTTQYSIEVEDKEDAATSPMPNIESKYQQANTGRPRLFKYRG